MTKDETNNTPKDTNHTKFDPEDPSYYDVSFDFPVDSDDESHSNSLSSKTTDSNKKNTSDQPSKWANFHADFHEQQRQQFMDLKNEDRIKQANDEDSSSEYKPFIDPAKEADRKQRAASLEDQIKTEMQAEEAVKASLMLDRSIRRVRSLFSDFDAYTPPASNPYKTDVQAALEQRQATSSYVPGSKPVQSENKQQALQTTASSPVSEQNESKPSWRDRLVNSKWTQTDADKTTDISLTNQETVAETDERVEDINEIMPLEATESVQTDTDTVPTDKAIRQQENSQNEPQPTAFGQRFASDLPSPEEIAQERERRRKLRIEQLEAMSSDEEIERTYQGGYRPVEKPSMPTKSSATIPKDSALSADSEPTIKAAKPLFNFPKQPRKPSVLSETPELVEVKDEDPFPGDEADTLPTPSTEPHSNDQDQVEPEIITAAPEQLEDIVTADQVEMDPEEATDDLEIEDNAEELQSQDEPDGSQNDRETAVLTDQDNQIAEDKADTITIPVPVVDSLEQDHTETKLVDLTTATIATTAAAASLSAIPNVVAGAAHVSATSDSSGEKVDLEDHALGISKRDDVTVTVIDDPIDSSPETEAYEKVVAEEPIMVSSLKKKGKPIYSLANYSLKEKILFGFNVTFNVFKRLFFYILLLMILLGAMAAGAGAGYFANLVSKTPPPSREEMAAQVNRLEQQSTLYYASGEPIANIRADIVRSVASIDNISPYIIDGLIATEDEEFYEHPGVMPRAILRATLETLLTGGGTGGSTLTQQLVKQQMLSHDVTFFRKANEILLALRLENYLSKDEILTAYLNVSPFGRNNNGDNVAGILKASEGIFGLKPDEVNLAQAAYLVGLPQDPYAYTPYDQYGEFVDDFQPGINRMHEVLFRMYREQKITQTEYEEALEYDVTQDFLAQEPREEQRQSYLYQAMMNGAIEQIMLLNIEADGLDWKQVYEDFEWYNEYYFNAEEELRTGGYRVYTTIDREIYDQLQVSAQAHNDQLGVTYDGLYVDPETGEETYYLESVQSGIVVIDNRSGKVLGFVAGTDYENNQIDHAFGMRRSPGSTIKPLAVYGPAVENNLITPATIIPDTEYVQEYEDGTVWRPTNYGNVVSGTYFSARTALLRSDNIPAVRIYEELLNRGVSVIDYLEKMGFNTVDSYTEADTQNLAFALGGVTTGPTVFEETRAFSTFANNGNYVDSYYIERIEDAFGNIVFQQDVAPVEVFSEDTNYILVDMLRDTNTEGSGRTAGEALAFGGDWIAKSGISENSKDVWYIASTPAITVGSWIGYDSQYADFSIDINDGFDREAVRSQTYWAKVVNDLYALKPEIFGVDQTFAQPDSVQKQTILTNTGTLPGNLTLNNRQYTISSPTGEDVFKVSHPAPALTYNFMFNATDADHQNFWAQIQQAADELRQQQQQQPASSQESSSSTPSSEESGDETSSDSSEQPGEESTPPAESPEGD